MTITRTLEERFWPKVDVRGPNECWPWKAYCDRYPRINEGGQFGKQLGAHRVSWEIANGERVPDGLVVMHSCDNPVCVNPSHLSVGTTADNTRDMVSKGRAPGQKKTHCPRGHTYNEENTFRLGNTRRCRQCAKITRAELRASRGIAPAKPANAERTHCPGGHSYSGSNLVVRNGRRNCRECLRSANRRWRGRQSAKEAA